MAEIKEINRVDLSKLIPYVNNAKVHSEDQISKIASSIREFGFVNPVLIDKDFNIIAGHGRVMAAKKLGLSDVPCVYVEGLSEAQRKAYILADNRLGELADWDMDLVTSELEMLQELDFDIDLTGFELPEENEKPDVQEDEVPEEVETRAKLGDIWKLGGHRLVCGDSTDSAVIEKLLDGNKGDLLITDPPYNVALGMSGSHPLRPSEAKQLHRRTDGLVIQNDSWKDDDEFVEFLVKAFNSALNVLRNGAVFYIWYADTQALNFRMACKLANMQIRQNLIWNKSVFAFGRQDYQWKHEPCLYGWKDGASHFWASDRKQVTVLNFDKPTKSELHPTMKPVGLFAYQISNNTHEGDNVLDIFGGSGTTLIACEQLNRKAFLCELDPHYCDVIIQRWENLTGKEAELINE